MFEFQKTLIGHFIAMLAIGVVYFYSKQNVSAHQVQFYVFAVYFFGHATELTQRIDGFLFFNEKPYGNYFLRVGFYTAMCSIFSIILIRYNF